MSESKPLIVAKKTKLIKKATTYYFPEEKTLQAKTKKTVLFSIDTALSAFVIAPLVVTNWHGVWLLYDLHAFFFPPVKTFFFANCVLLFWTFVRDIVQESFNKKKEQIKVAFLWKILAQIYVEVFNVLVNMQWRGAFMIFDMICSVEVNDLGNAVKENPCWPTIVAISTCIALLILLKSLRNSSAVPFIIILDNTQEMFNYPTRFRKSEHVNMQKEFKIPESFVTKCVITTTVLGILFFVILYLFILLTNGKPEIPQPEPLIQSPGFTIAPPPRPFVNDYRGPAPVSFVPNLSQRPLYPQLQESFNNPNYPRNVQDILSYLIEPSKDNKIRFPNHQAENNDPFHSYKPKDPGDVNLMATSNLRFAPPVWKDLKNAPSYHAKSRKIKFLNDNKEEQAKTISLTLNVYPMSKDGKGEHFIGVPKSEIPFKFFGGAFGSKRRAFGVEKPNKMVIHLNFMDEGTTGNEKENDYPYEFESVKQS